MVELVSAPRHIYTVSDITQDVKIILENTFGEVWVEGEVSGARKISTGTVFLTLKDNQAVLKCVVFSNFANSVKFELKDGLKVVCFGRIGVYEKEGQYQLYVEKIEPKGIGSLQLALEQLKARLEKEGLFSLAHKKPIPYLPSGIGVVTSLTGAAIKDILKVLSVRFKDAHIIINPVRVQGEGAAEEIARAIRDFNLLNNIDVMIVGRGGGSIEDLWAFNEEVVARAIYHSKIPVISAVGHERDWTIADLVADLRAPTPSAAAETVIPKKEELKNKLDDLKEGLRNSLEDIIAGLEEEKNGLAEQLNIHLDYVWKLNQGILEAAAKKLRLLSPAATIARHKDRILGLARQICVRTAHLMELKESYFKGSINKLNSLSPLNILSRGYSITFKMPAQAVVRDARVLRVGDTLKTRLHQGRVISQVTEVISNGRDKV